MDTSIEELLRQGLLGTSLTTLDWDMLLQEASDAGSLQGVFVASHKLKTKPSKAILENLLLTALCTGKCGVAIDTCKELQRELVEKERNLLAESLVLSGNVQEFFECIPIEDEGVLSMFHTTIAIAVSRLLRRNRQQEPPIKINLYSWVEVYQAELSLFNPQAKAIIRSRMDPFGIFFIFSKDTLNRFLGALLVENCITKECAQGIRFLDF